MPFSSCAGAVLEKGFFLVEKLVAEIRLEQLGGEAGIPGADERGPHFRPASEHLRPLGRLQNGA